MKHIWIFLIFFAMPAMAQPASQTGALEIEADNALEWDRANRIFTASGNAVASNAGSSVRADRLIAKYHENEAGKIIIETITAEGGAQALHEDDTITAQNMTAFLNAQNRLSRVEARGNVTIETPQETGTSRLALYDFDTEIAVMSGGVTLKRGANILTGEKAEFNLKTNVARLFSATDGQDGSQRVRGVFFVEGEE